MAIITDFTIPFEKGDNRIGLIYELESNENRITVIIGENGTRKSYLLRQFLDSALSKLIPELQPPLFKELESVSFLRQPNKVIAVSAVPYDRFPSKNNFGETSRISKFDTDLYSYIGPRTSSNIISKNQSVRELILNTLQHPSLFKERSPYLSTVLKEIGVGSKFSFGLNVHRNPYKDKGEIQIFSDYIKRGTEKKTSEDGYKYFRWPEHEASLLNDKLMSNDGQKLVSEIDDRIKVINHQKQINKRDSKLSTTFQVQAYLEEGELHTDGVSPEALYWALRFGYLQPTRIEFVSINGSKLSQDELSAGQWSLFSTMTSLSLSVDENTLILVDEPESCLHPSWQRCYIDYILKAISHARGCHVFLATHAPLILSSLPTSNSECVIFKKNGEDAGINAFVQSAPSGWDTNAILEDVFSINSARGPALTDILNECLGLIAKGVAKNKKALQKATVFLEPFLARLPEDDMVRDIIHTILEITNNEQ